MDQTFHQLGQLLLDSTPTVALFVVLHYYLKAVLYRPLQATLDERHHRIEGRLSAAQALTASAEGKLQGYEQSLRERRVENYKHIDSRRQAAIQQAQQQLNDARQRAAQALLEARQQLAQEQQQARGRLQGTSEALATQILHQVLGEKTASQPGAGL